MTTDPFQEVLGHLTDRAAIDEPHPDPLGVGPQQPGAGQRLGVGIIAVDLPLLQVQRLRARPGRELRQRPATPPGLVGETQDPIGVGRGQADQAVAGFFFRA
jgi:hypothetical protein